MTHEKSIQERQIAASTYHAAEALAILGDASTGPDVAVAQVHATLSLAAATRALVTL